MEKGIKMKKLLIVLLLIFVATCVYSNPSFTVGSNPYVTLFAFPHDIMKHAGPYVFLDFTYAPNPWQGNITNPFARPNDSYTTTYQSVQFATPDDYTGNPEDVYSYMNANGYYYIYTYAIGGYFKVDDIHFRAKAGYEYHDMSLKVDGKGRAEEEDATGNITYHMVPFEANTHNTHSDTLGELIIAKKLFDIPFGFKIIYKQENKNTPGGFLNFTREGTEYNTDHLTWGWATTGCNHIFNYSHINTDAFFLNSYEISSGHDLDLQISNEIDIFKNGIRIRINKHTADTYRWEYNVLQEATGTSAAVYDEYYGSYEVDPDWLTEKRYWMYRMYSKVSLVEDKNITMGILGFFEYDSDSSTDVGKRADLEESNWENSDFFALEANPFLNLKLKGGGYFDLGILFELAFSDTRNEYLRWNSNSNGNERILWNTSPYEGWSTSWERFSKSDYTFFATGFETSSAIPIVEDLHFVFSILTMMKYTNETKIYGTNELPTNSPSYQFKEEFKRENYKRETWLTGSFGLNYSFSNATAIFSVQMPLAYSIYQETKLYNQENGDEIFNHEKETLFQVQQSVRFNFILVWGFDTSIPWL